jgi:hypothetical protein
MIDSQRVVPVGYAIPESATDSAPSDGAPAGLF